MSEYSFSTHPADLARSQFKKPVYLTNTTCENVWGSSELFALLGLAEGEFDGNFYPLTKQESTYISDDLVTGTTAWAYTGYSALYLGKKWLAPAMEFDYPEEVFSVIEDGMYPNGEAAEQAAVSIKEKLDPIFAEVGGMILRDDDSSNRITLLFLIPFDYAMTFASFKVWKTELMRLLSGPIDEEEDEEKCERAFVWTAKARYVETVEHPAEVMFGLYSRYGGGKGEMAMRWYELGGRSIPRLECYCDSFTLLAELQPLIQALTTLSNTFTQKDFVQLLKAQGFKDFTLYG